MHKRLEGFTLVELMVVVAIIGILVMVGVPVYKQHVLRTGRGEAHANLLTMADLQERYYLDNNEYATTEQLNYPHSDNYKYSVEGGGSGQYSVLASAQGSQKNDDDCAVIALTSTGKRLGGGENQGVDELKNGHCW